MSTYWIPFGPAIGAQKKSTFALLASAHVALTVSGCGLPQGTNVPVAEGCQPAEVLVLMRQKCTAPACSPPQVKLPPFTAVPAKVSLAKVASWTLRSKYCAVAPEICCHWKATVALPPPGQLTLGWLNEAPAAMTLGAGATLSSANTASRPARTARPNLRGRLRS